MAGTLADAWAMWKADRGLLLPVAGLILFLPLFAIMLLAPAMPPLSVDPEMTDAARRVVAETVSNWMLTYGGWYLLASAIVQYGALVILILYLQADQPDLGAALARAFRLFPRYLPAMIITGLPLGFGQFFVLFLLPGLYLFGRLMVVGPILIAEPQPSIRRSVGRSWVLTRGNGLTAAALAGVTVLGGALAALPFVLIDHRLTAAKMANPVVIAMVDAAAAGVTAASMMAVALIQIAFYRRLLSSPVPNKGI
ncbi:hypothetical protein G4G27_12900 [Sphingomonas sp. So64.6b]|uniref:hypothetical protein n=1 Tax=Sphingomonas sp. So64.6b TaxID=2997354 RepID=UPI001601656E|nr:hypothetical protein [Sphingomonas sp. So64.6b]QNA84790.1 hypothetical protein G4G27_12900 [Sphingomonas sp. So64.6b]